MYGCGEKPEKPEQDELVLIQQNFTDLPDWPRDNLPEIIPAFLKSCERFAVQPAERLFFGTRPEHGDITANITIGTWQKICGKLVALPNYNQETLIPFFEENFIPYLATNHGIDTPYATDTGLFTGYYEAQLQGSRTQSVEYPHPLYRLPPDLVMVNLGEFNDSWRGQRTAGRVVGSYLKPYEDRAAIEAGSLSGQNLELVYVDDPVDVFFLHIQGSGRIDMDDGTVMRVGFDGQNGHVYTPIGRELIRTGAVAREAMSMQAIRQWLSTNPDKADELMNINRSYIFFRELPGNAPIGGQGVELTPKRSLAIDHGRLPYGMPVWVDIEHPDRDVDSTIANLTHLMMAQDTGGAIRGAVRGDYFWGHGAEAERLAGKMKSNGRKWIFLPR